MEQPLGIIVFSKLCFTFMLLCDHMCMLGFPLHFSLRGKDNVCCYGTSGNLLDSRVEEGGTLQRYHYLGGRDTVPYVTNLYYDVLPFLHCCRYFGPVSDRGKRGVSLYSECQDYIRFRNISSCYNYVPPRPGNCHHSQ